MKSNHQIKRALSMKINYIIFCLLLVSCATNDKPAEIISPNNISIEKLVKKANVKNAYYVVKSGDTVISIAEKFQLTPQKLLKLNKLSDGVKLVNGQRLLVKPRNIDEEKLLTEADNIQNLENTDNEQVQNSLPDAALSPTDTISNPKIISSEKYVIPVQGRVIKDYGKSPDGIDNKGINISAPKGVPVRSIADGIVKYAGSKAAGYGKMVMIKHPDGNISTYAHLNTIDVKPDTVVNAGTKIGTIGSTGNVTEPQLQLQIRGVNKLPIDPKTLIPSIGD